VESSKDASLVVVRARDREDLENLREFIPGIKVVELPNRDYEYRAFVKRHVWERTIRKLTAEIDYTNFKDSVTDKMGHKRHDLYMRVWSTMLSLGRSKYSGFMGDYWDNRFPTIQRTLPASSYRKKKGGKGKGRVHYSDGYEDITRLDEMEIVPHGGDSDECPNCQWPKNDGCMCQWLIKPDDSDDVVIEKDLRARGLM